MGVETALIGAAVIGGGVSLFGQLSAASAQEKAAQAAAQAKYAQADELLAREAINESIMRDEATAKEGNYITAFASSGFEGSGVGGVLKIKQDLEQNISLAQRDANFKAKMLRAGADVDTQLASDIATAGTWKAVGSLVGTVGAGLDIYSKFKAPSSAQKF